MDIPFLTTIKYWKEAPELRNAQLYLFVFSNALCLQWTPVGRWRCIDGTRSRVCVGGMKQLNFMKYSLRVNICFRYSCQRLFIVLIFVFQNILWNRLGVVDSENKNFAFGTAFSSACGQIDIYLLITNSCKYFGHKGAITQYLLFYGQFMDLNIWMPCWYAKMPYCWFVSIHSIHSGIHGSRIYEMIKKVYDHKYIQLKQ